MSSPSTGDQGDALGAEERMEAIAEDYLERLQRGESPSIEEYARAHPDLAEKIRKLLPALRFVEKVQARQSPLEAEGERAWIPERIGEFRIVRELGRGGMGIVFQAVQESLGRQVALKLLPSWARIDARRLERFREEARAAASLQHPNIVQVYGFGEESGIPYYAMQFIAGPSLDRVLGILKSRLGPPEKSAQGALAGNEPDDLSVSAAVVLMTSELTFPEKEESGPGKGRSGDAAGGPGLASGQERFAPPPASVPLWSEIQSSRYFSNVVCLGIQVADALAYAHQEGIVHRDVKPSNLLLDRSDRVWIADFGLAKVRERDDLTRSGEIVGTLRYMAPERLRGWSDPRSDIYGLGVTLYELLALRPVYEDKDPSRLMKLIAEEEPVPPRRLNPRIPRDLEVIVRKAIAREPAERYQTGRELAEDLGRFQRGEPVLARPTSTLRRSVKWARRRPASAALIAVTLLSAAAIYGQAAKLWHVRSSGVGSHPQAPRGSFGGFPPRNR